MFKFIKQNKHIVVVALTLFVISMSTIMFFLGSNKELNQNNLKTDVISVSDPNPAKQDEESKYRQIVHNDKDPLVVLNLDGSIKFSSANFGTALDYKEGDLNYHVFFLLVHPDDLSGFVSAFGKVLQTQQAVTVIGPYRLEDKNGKYHFQIASAFPVIEEDKVVSVAIVMKDITTSLQDINAKSGKKSDPWIGPKIINEKDKNELKWMAEKS